MSLSDFVRVMLWSTVVICCHMRCIRRKGGVEAFWECKNELIELEESAG